MDKPLFFKHHDDATSNTHVLFSVMWPLVSPGCQMVVVASEQVRRCREERALRQDPSRDAPRRSTQSRAVEDTWIPANDDLPATNSLILGPRDLVEKDKKR